MCRPNGEHHTDGAQRAAAEPTGIRPPGSFSPEAGAANARIGATGSAADSAEGA